jgi:hypothetical protein
MKGLEKVDLLANEIGMDGLREGVKEIKEVKK